MMLRPRAVSACVACLTILGASRALASTYSLGYEAPVGCPSVQAVTGEIAARSRTAEQMSNGGEYRIEMRFESPAAGKFVGSLAIQTPSGRHSSRTLDGATCGEVASALALIVALTLDPNARSEPIETLLSAADTADAADVAASVQEPKAASPASAARKSEPSRGGGAVVARQRSATGQLWAGIDGGWMSVLARNGGMALFGARAEYRAPFGLVVGVTGALAPSVQRDDDRGAEVASRFYGAWLELGFRFRVSGRTRLATFAAVSGGKLESKGVRGGRIAEAREWDATWLAVGPGVSLGRENGWAAIEVYAAMPFSLMRPEFSLQVPGGADERFYRVPSLGAALGLRLSLRLLGAVE